MSGIFYYRHWISTKCYIIVKDLVANLQLGWSGYLGKAVSSDVVCFSPGKSVLSGHHMIRRPVRLWFLSLSMPQESQSLFLVFWWPKGSITAMIEACPARLRRVNSGDAFPTNKISRMQGVMLKVLVYTECAVKRLLYQSMVIFSPSPPKSRNIPCITDDDWFYLFFLKLFILYWSIADYQCCDQVNCKTTQPYIHMSILSQTPLPPRLPCNTEQSSLCYTGSPCWLSS